MMRPDSASVGCHRSRGYNREPMTDEAGRLLLRDVIDSDLPA